MFGSSARVVSVEEEEGKRGNYKVQAWTGQGETSGGSGTDAPPEAFVQRIEHPGGDVVVSPMLEALRAWLRKGRDEHEEAPDRSAADAGRAPEDADAAPAAPAAPSGGATVSGTAQKRQGASEGGRSR